MSTFIVLDQPEASDVIDLWRGACNEEFSRVEIKHFAELLRLIPRDKFSPYVPCGDIDLQRYHYLAEKYAAMNRLDGIKHINNRFAYMLAILRSDAGINT